MSNLISLDCPECGASLKLKDRGAIGKSVRCPKCRASFVADVPNTGDVLDEDIWEGEDDSELEELEEDEFIPRRRSAPGRSAPKPRPPRSQRTGRHPAGRRERAAAGRAPLSGTMMILLAGGAVAVVALVLIAVGMFSRNAEEAEREKWQRMAEAALQRQRAQDQPGLARGQHNPSDNDPMATRPGQPITAAEAEAFAQQFSDIITAHDGEAYDRLFDHTAFLDRATAGVDAVPLLRQGFVNGYMQPASRHALLNELATGLGQGGSFELLRMHDVAGEQRLLFRLLGPEAGFAYIDVILARGAEGEARAVDIFPFGTGERFSETVGRGYRQVAASQGPTGRPTQESRELIQSAQTITQATVLMKSGQPQEAMRLIDGLPNPVRNSKTVSLLRINVTKLIGPREYQAAMQEFLERFAGDVAADLLSIDFHTLNGDFEKALSAVDRLDAAAGGDPALRILRANLKVVQGDVEAARELLNETIALGVAVEHAQWTLLSIDLAEQKFDQAVERLNEIEREFGIRRPDFIQQPEFAAFAASPQYAAWHQSRGESSSAESGTPP